MFSDDDDDDEDHDDHDEDDGDYDDDEDDYHGQYDDDGEEEEGGYHEWDDEGDDDEEEEGGYHEQNDDDDNEEKKEDYHEQEGDADDDGDWCNENLDVLVGVNIHSGALETATPGTRIALEKINHYFTVNFWLVLEILGWFKAFLGEKVLGLSCKNSQIIRYFFLDKVSWDEIIDNSVKTFWKC